MANLACKLTGADGVVTKVLLLPPEPPLLLLFVSEPQADIVSIKKIATKIREKFI